MAFSARQRPALLERLASEPFDVLVVGGGVTGAGVARDAALRGLRVALVDKGDFSGGTSSRSSKLIHGGLRYLEQGDVGLVFEAVRERQRLMKLAPHLARPLSFVVPVFRGSKRGVFVLDIGLTIYDTLAAFTGVIRHRALRSGRLLEMEPCLRREGLRGGVEYFDAQTNDARLVLANLRGANEAGAVCVSRVELDTPDFESGRLTAVRLRDRISGKLFKTRTHSVILAAGPWTDIAKQRWYDREAAPMMRPSKGVHIVIPRERMPLEHAVVMTAADGRVVFALPWPDATVLGTTDTAFEGPLEDPQVYESDCRYLLETANTHLVARGGALEISDVVSTWAGIRPLAIGTRDDGAASGTYQTSREHVVQVDPRGLVTIAGGKLTTYRLMADEAIEAMCPLLPPNRLEGLRRSVTEHLPLPGADRLPARGEPLEAMAELLVRDHGATGRYARYLVSHYGSDADRILDLCRRTPAGLEPVIPGRALLWGEVRWVVEEEMPLDLVDIAVRRLPLYYLAGDAVLDVADDLAERVCAWCGYPVERAAELVAGLRAHVEHSRPVAGM